MNLSKAIRSSKFYGLTGESLNVFPYVYDDGKESDTYTVSGWASANASCSTESDRAFDICIRITYSDNSYVWKPAEKFNNAVEEWQYAMQTFSSGYGNSVKNTYSGNNITKSVDCNGYETNYSYDDYNNLKTFSEQDVSGMRL